jgi:hypothetical protein
VKLASEGRADKDGGTGWLRGSYLYEGSVSFQFRDEFFELEVRIF